MKVRVSGYPHIVIRCNFLLLQNSAPTFVNCNTLITDEARYYFEMMQPRIMFATEQNVDMLVQAAKNAGIDCQFVIYSSHPSYLFLQDLLAQQSQSEVDSFRHVDPEEPGNQTGVIIFSSGTTGDPKGVMLSYALLLNQRYNMDFSKEGSTALWYSTMFWISGVTIILQCIRFRVTWIAYGDFDAEDAGRLIEKYKVR